MNRRNFVAGISGLVGATSAGAALGAIPCPPSLEGGSAPCGSPVSAEADWQARIQGPGVVWYHDFRSDAEVNNFRWESGFGQDPEARGPTGRYVRRNTTDGITGGGCLEIQLPPDRKLNSQWIRQFSPLRGSDNGRGIDDPAAGGSIARQAWNPVQGTGGPQSGSIEGWSRGNYAHPDYASQDDPKDGSEFYLQFRVKLQPEFLTATQQDGNFGGKLIYLTRTERSLTAQEIVVSFREGPNPFWMYYGGTYPMDGSNSHSPWPDVADFQPGSDYGYCSRHDRRNASSCWLLPYGEWHTYLMHVVPGHENDGHNSNFNDTAVTVWAARAGQKSYTKIWDRRNYNFDFQNNLGAFNGWNALICSNWHNSWAGGPPLWVRWDQIIFSKSFIPCPQV